MRLLIIIWLAIAVIDYTMAIFFRDSTLIERSTFIFVMVAFMIIDILHDIKEKL